MSLIESRSNQEMDNELELAPMESPSDKEINGGLEPAPIDLPVITWDSLSKSDKTLIYVAFLSNGVASLLAWNSVLNSSTALNKFIWTAENFAPLLGGVEYSMVTLTCLIMFYFNGLNVTLIYISGVTNLLVTTLFPTVTYVYSGNENLSTGKALLSLVSAIAGIGSGMFSVVGMSFASVMPFGNCVALVSTGVGMSGVITFISYLVLSHLVFEQTLQGQKFLLWAFFSFGSCIIITHIMTFTVLTRRCWFKRIVDRAILNSEENVCWNPFSSLFSKPTSLFSKPFSKVKSAKLDRGMTRTNDSKELDRELQNSKEQLNEVLPVYKPCLTELTAKDDLPSSSNIAIIDDNVDKSPPPPRHLKLILKDCWLHTFTGSLTAVITLFLYPRPGPASWGQSYTILTILFGSFQVFNMIMRYSPVFHFLRIRPQWLLPVVCMRVVFIPLFLIPSNFAVHPGFWRHPATAIVLMLLFTGVHGWSITLATIYATASVENPKEKAIVGKVLVVCYSAAIGIGLYASKILTYVPVLK